MRFACDCMILSWVFLTSRVSGPVAQALVPLHLRFDLIGPGSDASLQIDHIEPARLLQERRGVHAASAVMTDRHDVAVIGNFIRARRKLTQRNRHRTLDPAVVELVCLTHVEQERRGCACCARPSRFKCRQQSLELGRTDLANQKTNRSGCSAFSSGATTVSNRSRCCVPPADAAPRVYRRPCIAGAVPTTANSRPFAFI